MGTETKGNPMCPSVHGVCSWEQSSTVSKLHKRETGFLTKLRSKDWEVLRLFLPSEEVVNLKNKTISYFVSKSIYLGRASNCNVAQASYNKIIGKSREGEEEPFRREGSCKTQVHWNKLGFGSRAAAHWLGCTLLSLAVVAGLVLCLTGWAVAGESRKICFPLARIVKQ